MTEDLQHIDTAVWEKILLSLPGASAPEGVLGPQIPAVAQKAAKSLNDDLKNLDSIAPLLFSADGDHDDQTRQVINLLYSWHQQDLAPSLAALCVHALQIFKTDPDPALKHAVMMAAVLGDVDNTLAYHNNMHYRKVLLQLIRLINEHQTIYDGTAQTFAGGQIALLLIAACIHDLGHDGRGNTVQGVFVPGRLERQSFDQAAPYLKACGLTEADDLSALQVMLLTTEVTPLGDPTNPANQLKAAYRFHYLGEDKKIENLNLDPALARLQRDAALTLMALLLHEADIATSAGLTYAVTKFETALYRQELGAEDARPEHILEFLNAVCARKFHSNAAQALYARNMARIYALAEEEMKFGNLPFPQAAQADFLFFKDKNSRSFTTPH